MAVIGTEYLTMQDWAKRLDPDGGIAMIVEALQQSNPILQDAFTIQGNLPTGHRYVERLGLPSVGWRRINQGIANSKSRTRQVDAQAGMLEGKSEVDVKLAVLNGNEAAFRASEDMAFIQAMNNESAESLFYADPKLEPEKPMGFAAYYNGEGDSAENIVDGGGTGEDNTSMFLVTWGQKASHLFFPKGMKAGLQQQDLGVQVVKDSEGKEFRAYVTWFDWNWGLAVPDWRMNSRVANIDVSELVDDASTGANLIRLAIKAYYKRPTMALNNLNRDAWYVNKTIAEYLHTQAMNKTNVNLTLDMVDGRPVTKLVGAPVRVCDALNNAEDAISL
jgi:hypothetical protein